MHTDEYEISLFREIGVCSGIMAKYQKRLARLEQRHGITTGTFLEHCRLNEMPASSDAAEWLKTSGELQRWTTMRAEYEQLLQSMKVSNS